MSVFATRAEGSKSYGHIFLDTQCGQKCRLTEVTGGVSTEIFIQYFGKSDY